MPYRGPSGIFLVEVTLPLRVRVDTHEASKQRLHISVAESGYMDACLHPSNILGSFSRMRILRWQPLRVWLRWHGFSHGRGALRGLLQRYLLRAMRPRRRDSPARAQRGGAGRWAATLSRVVAHGVTDGRQAGQTEMGRACKPFGHDCGHMLTSGRARPALMIGGSPIRANRLGLLRAQMRILPHEVRRRQHRVHLARIPQRVQKREVLVIGRQAPHNSPRCSIYSNPLLPTLTRRSE